MPLLSLVRRHLIEFRVNPGAVVTQESAPVDRHRKLESLIDSGHDASGVAAPTDACQRRPPTVDILEAKQ